MQDSKPGEPLGDLGGRHGRAIVAQAGARQAALLECLRQAVGDDLCGLGQIPLQMTGEPGAIIEHAEEDRRLPLAACGEHLAGAMVTIPMPQAVDVFSLVAADLAIQQPRFGAIGACGLARCDALPLVETVRLHEAAQRVVAGHRPQIGSRLGERCQIVVMELYAPAVVRSVLCEQDLPHCAAHRGLLAGIGAQLAAQHAHRIAALLARAVEPPLDGREAETDRIARSGVTPLACRQGLDLGAQFAFGRWCR